jgi:hypothetical protein
VLREVAEYAARLITAGFAEIDVLAGTVEIIVAAKSCNPESYSPANYSISEE